MTCHIYLKHALPLLPSFIAQSDPMHLQSHHPSPPKIYTLSLHDALPICSGIPLRMTRRDLACPQLRMSRCAWDRSSAVTCAFCRSEEHTSELQSRFDLVCRLLL